MASYPIWYFNIGNHQRRLLEAAFPDTSFGINISGPRRRTINAYWTDGPSIKDAKAATAEAPANRYRRSTSHLNLVSAAVTHWQRGRTGLPKDNEITGFVHQDAHPDIVRLAQLVIGADHLDRYLDGCVLHTIAGRRQAARKVVDSVSALAGPIAAADNIDLDALEFAVA
jgi:hypothetical protein